MDSKKPFEHIEDRIKQAAENYQPPFDEKAWQAMEAKLDGDKKKRKPFLWWLAVPLLVAGLYGVYKLNNNNEAKEKNIAANTKPVEQKAGKANEIEKTGENLVSTNDNNKVALTENNAPGEKANGENNLKDKGSESKPLHTIDNLDEKNADTKNRLAENIIESNKYITAKTQKGNPHKISYKKKGKLQSTNGSGEIGSIDDGGAQVNNKQTTREEIGSDATIALETTAKQKQETNAEEKTDATKGSDRKTETVTAKTETKKEEKPVIAKKENEKKKKFKGFYIQATGGVDAGGIKMCSYKNSSFTAKYGAGIGYQFGKWLSIQTGFYASNKNYVAAPKDYTIKPGSPMGAYPLDKIKASCLVYEIPLAVKYDIVSKPSFILFGTAGLSSYIMQKEKYDCSYTYYNNIYETEWLFNGNKHVFSTAVFSIGIEKKLGKQFSLLAEPSLSVPINGVGDGKMKIYSSSLQMGLKYYLFNKQ